jgi:phosphatidylglycerol lysyltransferase
LFHGDGYVAYVDTGMAWVAAGPPVCRAEELASTVEAFARAARAAGRRCCLFGVESRLLEAVNGAVDNLQIGEQPIWDPRDWEQSLRKHAGLREQLRRARAKGVVVRPVTEDVLATFRDRVDRLIGRWLATRAMPPMGFLVAVPPALESVDGVRFIAWRQDRVVAIASLVPVPNRRGWFIEHLLRDPKAPNGTVELVIDAVMRWAASSDCSWLTLGLAPLAGDVPEALGFARRHLGRLYDFEGLRRFKAKLRPAAWIPIYLAFPTSQGPVASTFDALTAFATGGMVPFGVRFVTRGHPAVLALFAILLVPWMLLLALSSSAKWFAGHAAVKWTWIAFDLVVTIGMVQLVRRPSWRLAAMLAVAVSSDTVLTTVEALTWNVPRAESAIDFIALAAAIGAPLLAAVALWGAAWRLKRTA